jgi:hypothetical protein
LLDPVDGLAVSVLTNAIDGPAAEMAKGLVKLLNLGVEAGGEEPDTDLDRFTGAFAHLWGRLDVVRFGPRLLGLRLQQADPTELAIEFAPEDEETLRVTSPGSGFGAYGELMHYAFDDDGSVRSVRGPGGIPATPLDEFAASIEAMDAISASRGHRGEQHGAGDHPAPADPAPHT